MKKIICTLTIATLLFSACKKDDTIVPQSPKNYTGQWSNVSKTPEGPLDFFKMKLVLNADKTGTSEFEYTDPYHTYPQTNLTWEKIAGDSVVISLNIPAYPSETWELRGLNNKNNTLLTADYYSIPNNDPAGKFKYGTMSFMH